MMRQVLLLMAKSGYSLTISNLASALGVRPVVVEDLLGKLTALGYVQDIDCPAPAKKPGTCAACVFGSACCFASSQHVWILTEKGRRAALKGLPLGDHFGMRS